MFVRKNKRLQMLVEHTDFLLRRTLPELKTLNVSYLKENLKGRWDGDRTAVTS